MCDQRFTDSSSLSHHRKRHAGVIHQTPRVITQQTITSANGEQAVIVTTGGDEDEEVDSEDEAAQAAAALTGRATLGRATHLLADGGIVFEVHNE
jgi:ribosomal protein L18